MRTSLKTPEQPLARAVPCWNDVEQVLDRLVETGEELPTHGTSSMIESYQRGRRLLLQSGVGSRWLSVDDIRECWATFERLGRIRRQDVLEPGRCSAFMVELFAQVPGVVEDVGTERYLVLPE